MTAGHLLELEDGERLSKIKVYNGAGVCVMASPKPIPQELLSKVPAEARVMTDGTRIEKHDVAFLLRLWQAIQDTETKWHAIWNNCHVWLSRRCPEDDSWPSQKPSSAHPKDSSHENV